MQLGFQKGCSVIRHTDEKTSLRDILPSNPFIKDAQVINQTIQERQPKLFDLFLPETFSGILAVGG
jgi:hypothetical protein